MKGGKIPQIGIERLDDIYAEKNDKEEGSYLHKAGIVVVVILMMTMIVWYKNQNEKGGSKNAKKRSW